MRIWPTGGCCATEGGGVQGPVNSVQVRYTHGLAGSHARTADEVGRRSPECEKDIIFLLRTSRE
jgi:hypothetical protein